MTEDDGLTPAQRLLRGEGTAIITAADLAKMSDTGEIPDSVREGVEGLMSKPAAKRPARKRAPRNERPASVPRRPPPRSPTSPGTGNQESRTPRGKRSGSTATWAQPAVSRRSPSRSIRIGS
jgi:hypothetical protein